MKKLPRRTLSESCRRKGPDMMLRSLRWLALAGWGLMAATLFVFDQAKPETTTVFERHFGIHLRTWWDAEMAGRMQSLLWAGLVISLLGLAANASRRRRSSDEWRINLWLLLLTSLISLFLYFRFF
ncbi:MAG: hypothetical protein R2940_08855 [Syntrophotaleaceae bacterium]